MNIVAFTGAGISKASGIPTFEEMPGIRKYLSRDYFEKHPESFYQQVLKMHEGIRKAKPNNAHLALSKYNIPVITMNVDGLHQKAGSKQVVELHGNLTNVRCPGCHQRYPFQQVAKGIDCPECGRLLQHEIILYGDLIPNYPRALELTEKADLLLVIGTSFYTSTANVIVGHAQKNLAEIHIINEKAETEVERFLAEYL